jgi:replication-associated recombination protein RarA
MPKAWKGAILVCGEHGTGKSRWVKEEAAAAKARLFRWNVRTDRSLREGREVLHQQVRSKERMFVWIEGADDLTQEAQAFLRRILETAAPSVTCVLEAREMWKLSPPILSRCTVVSMRSETSTRAQLNMQRAIALGLLSLQQTSAEATRSSEIPALRKAAADPYAIFNGLFQSTPIHSAKQTLAIEAQRAIGAGSSPWIQLANYLMRQETAPTAAAQK